MELPNADLFNAFIELENLIYHPGEIVKGSIEFDLLERLKVDVLRIGLVGDARINWTRSTSSSNFLKFKRRVERNYKAQETFMNDVQTILAKPSFQDFYLEAGHHSYKFSFMLPRDLPSSFEHPSGRVRYRILGIVNFQFKTDIPIQRSFSVLSLLDLNLFQNLRNPDSINVTKSMKICCCFHSGKLTSTLTILKGGYVCGESIVFSLNILNNSSRTVRHASVKLVQKISIQNKTALREVASFSINDRIRPRMAKNVYNAALPIPPVCPTSNEKCKLIRVNYFLLLTFNSPRKRLKQKLDDITVPIVIGTIPFASNSMQACWQDMVEHQPCIFGANFKRTPKLDSLNELGFNESDLYDFRPLYAYYDNFNERFEDYSIENNAATGVAVVNQSYL